MDSAALKTHFKKNFTLAYPVVLSQLGHILVSVADSVMAGQLGTLPLAAASLGNSLFNVTLMAGLGISFSITPLIAGADGNQNRTRIGFLLLNGFVLNLAIGLLLIAFYFVAAPLVPFLGQPENVVELALPYLRILFFSILPLMVFQAFKQFAEGLALTRQAMYISVFANLLNIGLNYILIFGKLGAPALGLNGAAWATFIARVVMGGMMVAFVFSARRFDFYTQLFRLRNVSLAYMRRIFLFGLPISLQMIFEMGAFGFSAIMIGWLGVKELAAHQIAINIAAVTYMMASGIAAAATIRVGNNRGRKDKQGIRLAGYSSFLMVMLFMATTGLLLVLANQLIPGLYVDDPEVIQMASGLIIIAALFQLSDGVQVVGLGALRGLEDVKMPSLISLLAYWLLALPIGYFLGFVLKLGVNGIWYGLLIGLSLAAVLLFTRFQKVLASQKSF
ncbi:MATE family efflux transporter [soil metagenome]